MNAFSGIIVNTTRKQCLFIASMVMVSLVVCGCGGRMTGDIDALNEKSYFHHYRNLDSTLHYATLALEKAKGYKSGRAEAMNNIAFVKTARMDYDGAFQTLDSIDKITGNEVELLIADVGRMRLCQRESKNKDFYVYREKALKHLRRINEDKSSLNEHLLGRLAYAENEFHIVESAYFYYIGLIDESREAMEKIDVESTIEADTAQLLNYYYNMGSGGMIVMPDKYNIAQKEMELLLRATQLARKVDCPYWEANALQAMAEHLNDHALRAFLVQNNIQLLEVINEDRVPDSLLATNLTARALNLFLDYGDVYQIAGCYRTMAESAFAQGKYPQALEYLNEAIERNEAINKAPDLVASIREQLSMAYSAVDDKPMSDHNRNIYLDMQEQTRMDRQWEARAEQLHQTSNQVNVLLGILGLLFIVLVALLFVLYRKRQDKDEKLSADNLIKPLKKWTDISKEKTEEHANYIEELNEKIDLERLKLAENTQKNIEQHAKVEIVNNIRPLIIRLATEIEAMKNDSNANNTNEERREYINELIDKINEYNQALTRWIELRRGELGLKVESFELNSLFDIVAHNSVSFAQKGVTLNVEPADSVVKADKALTFFMINTLTDNARKFTDEGGHVWLRSKQTPDYVEISVEDDGCGMTEEQVAQLFDRKKIADEVISNSQGGEHNHGFALLNCKGIIEKYKKTSQIFSVCDLFVKSKKGEGSTFSFRLPNGRLSAFFLAMMMSLSSFAVEKNDANMLKANAFADMVYDCNINGDYEKTLHYADSCRQALNDYCLAHYPKDVRMMTGQDFTSDIPAEIEWYRKKLDIDYGVILSMRNESAVAALALHKWDLYNYNNKVYTQLFREMSADKEIPNYVKLIEQSSTSKSVAAVMLALLSLLILISFYMIYYRKRLSYNAIAKQVERINLVLLSDEPTKKKLDKISSLWSSHSKVSTSGISDEYSKLSNIVEQIKSTLKSIASTDEKNSTQAEQDTDKMNMLAFENNRLHVNNSMIDNCLSTLKHETMYYPARLRNMLAEDGSADIDSLTELAEYYRDIYLVFSRQANGLVTPNYSPRNDLVGYLLATIKQINDDKDIEIEKEISEGQYARLSIPVPNANIGDADISELFTPSTPDFRFLVCRQILREIGECTAMRASGIVARRQDNEQTLILEIILPDKIWKNSKSL